MGLALLLMMHLTIGNGNKWECPTVCFSVQTRGRGWAVTDTAQLELRAALHYPAQRAAQASGFALWDWCISSHILYDIPSMTDFDFFVVVFNWFAPLCLVAINTQAKRDGQAPSNLTCSTLPSLNLHGRQRQTCPSFCRISLFAQSNLQRCKEGIRYYHPHVVMLHPSSHHRAHLKHLRGQGEWYHTLLCSAPSACTQQATLGPWADNRHFYLYPSPIPAPLQLISGKILWTKLVNNLSAAVRVGNACPKNRFWLFLLCIPNFSLHISVRV